MFFCTFVSLTSRSHEREGKMVRNSSSPGGQIILCLFPILCPLDWNISRVYERPEMLKDGRSFRSLGR